MPEFVFHELIPMSVYWVLRSHFVISITYKKLWRNFDL